MNHLSKSELADIYADKLEATLSLLESKGLDRQDSYVRATARDIANRAVNEALGN